MPQSEFDADGQPMPSRRIPTREDFPQTGANSLASIGQRGVARIIDLLVLSVPAVLVVVPFVHVDGDEVTADVPQWVGMVALGILVAYETMMIAWRGQTVGKWVMGLRVARFTDGGTPTVGQALLRILFPACFLAIPIPVIDTMWIVVYLSSMYSPMRRGWHDKAGGTIVIRTR